MRHPGTPNTIANPSGGIDSVYEQFLKTLTSSSVQDALDWLADTDEDVVALAHSNRIGLVHEVVRCDDHDIRMHCFRRLQKLGANFNAPDNTGSSPLHVAVQAQDLMATRILLHLGASPNARDSLGRTPLHWSSEAGRITLTFALIDAGAWKHVRDQAGKTYVDLATPALRRRLEMIQAIRGLSAKVDLRIQEHDERRQIASGSGEYRMHDGE